MKTNQSLRISMTRIGTRTGISSLHGPGEGVSGKELRVEKMRATLARLSLLLPLGGVRAPCQALRKQKGKGSGHRGLTSQKGAACKRGGMGWRLKVGVWAGAWHLEGGHRACSPSPATALQDPSPPQACFLSYKMGGEVH